MIAKKMDILTEAESQVGDLVVEEDVELEAATVFLTMYSRTQNDFITIIMYSGAEMLVDFHEHFSNKIFFCINHIH